MRVKPLALITGADIPVIELQQTIHQPRIKEIALLGETEYFSALQTLCFDKRILAAQGNSNVDNLSNFQVLMTIINDSRVENSESRKNSLLDVLGVLFPGFMAQLLPTGIYMNNANTKQSFIINETNFSSLQEVVKDMSGVMNNLGGQNANFNPHGAKAAAIAAKLMKGRERANKSGGKNGGVLGRYISILTIALGSMSMDKCADLTVPQIFDLVERYSLYINWDLDIRSRLAGGKPDKQPDDWMKDLY